MRRLVITGAMLAFLAPAGLVAASAPPDSTPSESMTTEAMASEVMTTEVMTSEAMTSEAMTSEAMTSEAMTSEAMTSDATGATAGTATIYDDAGAALATVTVTGSEMATTDYEQGNDPDADNEYVRVTVQVESQITEGTFSINVDDFILQDNNGFVTTASTVPTAAQAEAGDEVADGADLATGESLELALTFQVDSAAGAKAVFYRPDDTILVDIADLG